MTALALALAGCAERDERAAGAAAPSPSQYEADLAKLDAELAALAARTAGLPTSWTLIEGIASGRLERARLTGDYNDYAIAESLLERAFEIAPTGAGPFLARAGLNVAMHRLDRVEADLVAAERQVVIDDAMRAEIDGLRAEVAFSHGNYEAALAAYRVAADRAPSLSSLFRLAAYSWQTADFARAESLITEAERAERGISPRPRAWLELQRGLLDLDRGRLDAALAHYRVADSLYSGWWLIEEHIAEIATLQGRHEEARLAYERLIPRTGDPEFMDALASVLDELGDAAGSARWTSEAHRVYEERLARYPEASYGHALGHFLEHEPDAARAVEIAERNRDLRPGGEAQMRLAQAYLRVGRADAAAAAIALALASPWRTAELHATAALVFDAVRDEKRAADQRGLAEAINPGAMTDVAWLDSPARIVKTE
ncbi:MAG: tetratricopeptide repeat protein [bacterium]